MDSVGGEPVPVRAGRSTAALEQLLALSMEEPPSGASEDVNPVRAIEALARIYCGSDDYLGTMSLGELWGIAAMWQHAAGAQRSAVIRWLDRAREMYDAASKAYGLAVLQIPDFANRLTVYTTEVPEGAGLKEQAIKLSPVGLDMIEEEAKLTDKVTATVVPTFSLLKAIEKLEAHYRGRGDFFGLKAVSDMWRTVAEQRRNAGMQIETVIDDYEKARAASNAALQAYRQQTIMRIQDVEQYLVMPLDDATASITLLGRQPKELHGYAAIRPEPVLSAR